MNEERMRRSFAVGYWKTVERLATWVTRPEAVKPHVPDTPSPGGRRWLLWAGIGGGTLLVGGTTAASYMQYLETSRDWTDPYLVPTPTLGPHEQIPALPRTFPGRTESQILWEKLGLLDVVEHSGVLILNTSKYLLLSFNRYALDTWYRHAPLGLASTTPTQRFLVLSPIDVYDERTLAEARAYVESLAVQYDTRAIQAGVDRYNGYIALSYLFGNLKAGYGEYPLPLKLRDRFRHDVTRHLNQMLLLRLQRFIDPIPVSASSTDQKIIQQALDFIDRVPNPKTDLPIRVDYIDHELLAQSVPKG